MTEKKVRGPRKKSPRTQGKRTISAASARLKELWQTPEFRARMAERDKRIAADRKANPEKYSRAGVPDGMRRAQAEPLWARARELADRFIQIMKDKGELPQDEIVLVQDGEDVSEVRVPSSDDGKAEAALREAFVLAVGPSDQKIKIQAINTVLNFTKSKPESKSKLTLERAEDFLDAVAKDNDGAD
ncbi:hypothetical protein [Bradyrhizobium sp. BR 10289]|uniref:hypothetical protein n=1 Tax=Bradyrhizobium sp. BR 10289 TaxID=2749993 RepID=UPI001C65237E|nr:hypothetical protein [Bradyrhizobium sp. BR 10289]MBW7970950.1 hypothetical protein [Bradyrhizobium sp. BR 10289]